MPTAPIPAGAALAQPKQVEVSRGPFQPKELKKVVEALLRKRD